MAAIPDEINLCRARGDTFAFEFTVKDAAGAVVDVTGASFLMTVDLNPDPTTSDDNLFQLTATLVDPTNGVISFTPSAANMDQVFDIYFYDIQMTDSGGAIRTIAKGQFEITADITK